MTDTSPPPFVFYPGTAPLLVSMPHAGTYVPPALAARFTDEARQVPDTDWHMERLYAFAKDLGASILVATHSRYVVDLNRPPDGASLYPKRPRATPPCSMAASRVGTSRATMGSPRRTFTRCSWK